MGAARGQGRRPHQARRGSRPGDGPRDGRDGEGEEPDGQLLLQGQGGRLQRPVGAGILHHQGDKLLGIRGRPPLRGPVRGQLQRREGRGAAQARPPDHQVGGADRRHRLRPRQQGGHAGHQRQDIRALRHGPVRLRPGGRVLQHGPAAGPQVPAQVRGGQHGEGRGLDPGGQERRARVDRGPSDTSVLLRQARRAHEPARVDLHQGPDFGGVVPPGQEVPRQPEQGEGVRPVPAAVAVHQDPVPPVRP